MRTGRLALVATFSGATALAFALALGAPAHAPPPPVHAVLPPFSLVDTAGRPFGREDLRGAVWVVDTVFTRCVTVCPRMSRHLRALQDRIGGERAVLGRDPRVRLLSIGVDPAHDTTDELAAYATRWRADPELWRFVTGAPDEVDRLVVEGLRLGLVREGGEGPQHAERFVLVDGNAGVRGWFDDDEKGLLRLEQALVAMRRELR